MEGFQDRVWELVLFPSTSKDQGIRVIGSYTGRYDNIGIWEAISWSFYVWFCLFTYSRVVGYSRIQSVCVCVIELVKTALNSWVLDVKSLFVFVF